jgi:hypothetical protein
VEDKKEDMLTKENSVTSVTVLPAYIQARKQAKRNEAAWDNKRFVSHILKKHSHKHK